MEPDALFLVLCDKVQAEPDNYQRLNIIGVITSIRSAIAASFPVVQSRLMALILWTGGQGSGDLTLRILEDRTRIIVFRTRPRQVRFVGDATAVGGVVFRIQNCSFPSAGLYWAEVVFAGSIIARQRLFLREDGPLP